MVHKKFMDKGTPPMKKPNAHSLPLRPGEKASASARVSPNDLQNWSRKIEKKGSPKGRAERKKKGITGATFNPVLTRG